MKKELQVDNMIAKKMFKDLWGYYDTHGRHKLAWRKSVTPYKVVVSEIMLQQTQVARVEGYFRDWMRDYPSFRALAKAPLKQVLMSWQGLGYNRRGKYLHDIAKTVTAQYNGRLPQDREQLEQLPGIGHYTAGSIRAFAFDQSDIFMETNIRTVLFHYFYQKSRTMLKNIPDTELLELLEVLISKNKRARENPRELYWALMDYGSHLKSEVGNLNKQSKTYTKQSRFEGSRRQLRAQTLRYILHNEPVTENKILTASNRDKKLVKELLKELLVEGSIQKKESKYFV